MNGLPESPSLSPAPSARAPIGTDPGKQCELSDQRPHLVKARHFESQFPHRLESNEWLVKWPIAYRSRKTYNPDYWCAELSSFVELATSKANISTQGPIWKLSIASGYPLRVYWWQGWEITSCFEPGSQTNPLRAIWMPNL